MNAKKIMGAVLVALLAAALFVGAGAAATEDKGTVFIYQDLGNTDLDGTWTAGNAVVSINNGVVMAGANFVAGTYTKGDYSLYVTYPTASYFATADVNPNEYIVDGIVYFNDQVVITVTSASNNMTVDYVNVYYENGAPEQKSVTSNQVTLTGLKAGSYKVVAHFADTGLNRNSFVTGTPNTYKYDTVNALSFKVVKEDEVVVTASADSILVGGTFTITVTGVAGQVFDLSDDSNGKLVYELVKGTSITQVTLPNTGVATIYVTVATNAEAGDYEITVTEQSVTTNDASVDIEVVEGTITAAAEKESYYIGDKIKLTGTTTAGDNLFVYIAGTNFAFTKLAGQPDVDGVADTWEFEIEAADFKTAAGDKPDAGTYAIYVSTYNGALKAVDLDDQGTYATTTVNLIQPFISLTTVPDVIIKGEVAKFIGTAEATQKVAYYIFGTNYFAANNQTSVKDGEFTIKLEKADTNGMAAGQYFIVVQHMMYDKKFNIWANDTTGEVFYAVTTSAGQLGDAKVIFNVKDRQTANAAQALCDNLDSQDIDDMYVKASFIVAEGTSVINPIPEEITKGSKLTISGTTTGHVGDVVTVEILSTAFAAVPKDTVGSASFIALSTKVAEDGTWEVTFDTSSLNVDEYSVSVAVGALGGATTTKINVVEGAPVTPEQPETPVTPEQPEQPEQPTEPETPGFGALAALAGLGAVAVLLLRRE